MFVNNMMMGGSDYGDPYFDYVTLLIKGDGPNNSVNITDSSKYNTPLALYGNTKISTASSAFNGSSIYFDGTGDYLINDDAGTLWDFPGDFTVEFWINREAHLSTFANILDFRVSSNSNFHFYINASNQLLFFENVLNAGITASTTLTIGTWYHIAATRSCGVMKLFVNGVREGGTLTSTTNYSSPVLTIGTYFGNRNTATTDKFKGYLDNIRVTNGYCRYVDDFTVPTRDFQTSISTFSTYDPYYTNVSLLLHGDGNNIITQSETMTGMFNATANYGWNLNFDGKGNVTRLIENTANSEHFCDKQYPAITGTVYTWSFDVVSNSSRDVQIRAVQSGGNDTRGVFRPSTGAWITSPVGSSGYVTHGAINLGTNQSGHIIYRLYVSTTAALTTTLYGRINTINGSSVYTGDGAGFVDVSRCQLHEGSTLLSYKQTKASIFSDSSTNNMDVTSAASTILISPTTKYGNGSIYFGGSGAPSYGKVVLANSDLLDMSTGDFTIEYWAQYTSLTPADAVDFITASGVAMYRSTSTSYSLHFWNGSATFATGITPVSNQWYHIALSRVSGYIYIYVDGVLKNSTIFNGAFSMASCNVGARPDNSGLAGCRMSDLRITKGVGRYFVNAATVPSAAFPETDFNELDVDPLYNNTQILLLPDGLHGNSTIKDSSKNNLTLTRSGDVVVWNNIPAVSDEPVKGAKGLYFDGTGDYLRNTVTPIYDIGHEVTIECWVRRWAPTDTVNLNMIWDLRTVTNNEPCLYHTTTGVLTFFSNNAARITGPTLAVARWYHVAVCKFNNIWSLYVDGVSYGSYSDTAVHYGANLTLGTAVNQLNTANTTKFSGWLSNFRITKDAARYKGNFRRPEKQFPTKGPDALRQLTDDPSFNRVEVLLHMDGPDTSTTIKDLSKNNLTMTAATGAFLTTGVKKFGVSSCWLGGSSYVSNTSAGLMDFPGDFTVEVWFHPYSGGQTAAADPGIIDIRGPGASNAPIIYMSTAGVIYGYINTGIRFTSSAVAAGQWHHIAMTRQSGVVRMWLNGAQVGSDYAFATAITNTMITLGTHVSVKDATTNYKFRGYMDEVRVIDGHCKYSSAFTPSTKPFPDRGSPV